MHTHTHDNNIKFLVNPTQESSEIDIAVIGASISWGRTCTCAHIKHMYMHRECLECFKSHLTFT